MRVIHYTAAQVDETEVTDPRSLESVRDAEGVSWIDIQGLGDEELLREVGRIFFIHPLALEDAVNVPQRPTTDVYDDHQLYISRMAQLDHESGLQLEQVSIFFGRNYVLTIQERYGDVLDAVRRRIRDGKGPMRRSGPDYLAYAIIDTIIDYYYPVLEDLSDRLERLEDEVIEHATPAVLAEINRVKRHLLDLRRGIAPQRDAVNVLVRGDSAFVTKTVRVYLRDCYDHCVQIVDVIESYREMAGGLLNTYLSSVSNRTNEVMKVLTIMASIFIPLTFMAGIYGMNFEAMPELQVRWFYPLLWVIMISTAAGMLIYFRRKGWLGRDRRHGGRK